MSLDLARLMAGHLHKLTDAQQKRDEAKKIAGQFEDVLVRTFVSSLRETTKIGDEGGGMFGDGPGADTYADWFDDKLSHELSRSGHIGVADVLMKEFERWKQIPAAPEQTGKQPAKPHAPTNLLEIDRRVLRDGQTNRALDGLRAAPATGGFDVAA